MVGTAGSVLIREVFFIQSVLYREVPLCVGLAGHLVPCLLHSSLCSYIISFSRSNPDDPESVIVWDTRTGVKKRGFSASDATDWPVLK